MGFIISIAIILGSMLIGALLGFFIPFTIAQFDGNPAWSFVTMISVPAGIVLGLIIGIIILFVKK